MHPEQVLLQDAEHSRRAHRQENSEGACVLRFNGGYPTFLKRLLQRCGSASGFLSSTKTAAPRISESIDWNACELCTHTYFRFLVSKFSLMFCFSAKIVKTKKARHKGSSDLPHILARSTDPRPAVWCTLCRVFLTPFSTSIPTNEKSNLYLTL